MKNENLSLFLEINKSQFIFFVGKNSEQDNSEKIYKKDISNVGFQNGKVFDFEQSFNFIKENIYTIEQKFNCTFKEIVLILDYFNPTFINITGFKKLNGSQILKENITYILNSLKSHVDINEPQKKILHIFNSEFNLDKNKIENLPIGLFGDFYSHELSFATMSLNEYKNLKNIFLNCNLKIKKILLKSFIESVNTSESNENIESFFQIRIDNDFSKIHFFENNSLKYEQSFSFGSKLLINDISKITSLKIETIKLILSNIEIGGEISNDQLVEKNLFKDEPYKKIKKKLIYDIALARIEEFFEIILLKNINLFKHLKTTKTIFLEINDKLLFKSFKEIFKLAFSMKGNVNVSLLDNISSETLLNTANKLVHFGWKKEAIPVSYVKKSFIARFFDTLFN